MMKLFYLTILLQFILHNIYGQQDDAFIDSGEFTYGLTVSVDSVKKPYSFSERNVVGHATFSYKDKDVTYHILDWAPSDSVFFSKIQIMRISMENCAWKGRHNRGKGFRLYFIRGNYYYLLQNCPCGATSKGRCGKLASKIRRWFREES